MTPFPEQKLNQIITDINSALDNGAHPIAAFDADGTLWDTDIGEDFFHHLIKNNKLDLPENPVEHYKTLYAQETPKALKWLADILCHQTPEQVREWASQAVSDNGPLPLFPAQQEIIDHLYAKGVEVYVVTASVKLAVEPAAKFYKIDHDHVIGIKNEIENGKITDKLDGHITWREGKVTALLEHTNNKDPFFCSGNSEGDLFLLKAASHLKLVHAAAKKDHELFETEQKMIDLAKQENWHFHSYYS